MTPGAASRLSDGVKPAGSVGATKPSPWPAAGDVIYVGKVRYKVRGLATHGFLLAKMRHGYDSHILTVNRDTAFETGDPTAWGFHWNGEGELRRL
jgi:hypothetical protein